MCNQRLTNVSQLVSDCSVDDIAGVAIAEVPNLPSPGAVMGSGITYENYNRHQLYLGGHFDMYRYRILQIIEPSG